MCTACCKSPSNSIYLEPPNTPPAGSRATACAPTRCPSRSSESVHPSRVERRPPAALVVPRELEVVALVRHADRDVPDPSPGVEPGPQRPEGEVVGRSGKSGEPESCSQELAAFVEHALFDQPNVQDNVRREAPSRSSCC
jgi:hypothetical protein